MGRTSGGKGTGDNMKTKTPQHERLDWLVENLIDERIWGHSSILPHGSGIDGTWQVHQQHNGNVIAECSYHLTDETGCYCGWQDFSIKFFPVIPDEVCRQCGGTGERTIQQIAAIRGVDVDKIDKDSLHVEWIDDFRFVCNACKGNYNPPILDFKLSFHRQRQRCNAAYGLREYLEETIGYAVADCLKRDLPLTVLPQE